MIKTTTFEIVNLNSTGLHKIFQSVRFFVRYGLNLSLNKNQYTIFVSILSILERIYLTDWFEDQIRIKTKIKNIEENEIYEFCLFDDEERITIQYQNNRELNGVPNVLLLYLYTLLKEQPRNLITFNNVVCLSLVLFKIHLSESDRLYIHSLFACLQNQDLFFLEVKDWVKQERFICGRLNFHFGVLNQNELKQSMVDLETKITQKLKNEETTTTKKRFRDCPEVVV